MLITALYLSRIIYIAIIGKILFMINFFTLEETWDSLKQHKNRNILTGFGVAWGIFILVLLVGAGSGLQKGVMSIFQDYTKNSMWIYGGKTSMSKPGQRAGRHIIFNTQDLDIIQERYPEIEYMSAELSYSASSLHSLDKTYRRFKCLGVKHSYFNIKTFDTSTGRLLNPSDEALCRKVAVIGKDVALGLFGKTKALGKYFCLDDVWFKIVGILSDKSLFSDHNNDIYLPLSTLQLQYNKGNDIDCFAFALNNKTDAEKFEKNIKSYLARRFKYSVDDKNAIYIDNMQASTASFNSLFKIINIFLWIVGICMILSGIVGVTNIMLVVVKERNQEIGIRKALGATPNSILWLIINESIAITLVSGIVGMLSACGAVFVINAIVSNLLDDKNSIFNGLEINFAIAVSAIILLVISGALAGLYPAKKAASVMPIQALNSIDN